ncbi:MAG: cell surface protein SprA [Candidatus Eisenbacteria bacterium]|uniref:Cell surface protein SprA n=1 Tax=Eiseniibacteriota bacterium TaxID=2212470 RepID=A0A956SC95_UNCEI|nr:cell surface protein SprA [Candidatus Eisenbacteria bacterium]
MKTSFFHSMTAHRVAAALAVLVISILVSSCGRSQSGWVGRGGSIFAGGGKAEPELEEETAPPDTGRGRGPARTLEEIAAQYDQEVEPTRPDRSAQSGRKRPTSVRERAARLDSLRTATTPGAIRPADVARVEAARAESLSGFWTARRDSLAAIGAEVPDSLTARVDSLARVAESAASRAAEADASEIADAELEELAGAEADTTDVIPDWVSEASGVSTWTPDQMPEEAYFETPAEARLGSAFRPFAQSEQLDPAQDAWLYRMAQTRRLRAEARQSPILGPSAKTVIDTTEFRPWTPDGPELKAQDFISHQYAFDYEQMRITFDNLYDSRVPVRPKLVLSMDEYIRRLESDAIHRLWTDAFHEDLARTDRKKGQDRLINLDIPVELPGGLQGIFGKGKPSLSVSGSETISLQGRSRWFPNMAATETQGGQSKFPQLTMEQKLNLRLTGTIGDKVTVDVEQSSESDTPLANRIKIRYNGYEDEIVQRVELGNTSLRLPGTKYVSFNGQAEGLFGINALAKLGDVDFNLILSKQEGKSDEKSIKLTAEVQTVRIEDYDYVAGTFFFLRDPDGCPWRLETIQLYLDDQDQSNDTEQNAIPATATLNGEAPVGDEPLYEGKFHQLEEGVDFDIVSPWFYYGHPAIQLRRPIVDTQTVLAVQLTGTALDPVDLSDDGPIRVGGVEGGKVYLAMLRPVRSNPRDLASGPWGSLAKYEMKNVYDLGARNVLQEGFEMKIRRKYYSGEEKEPDRTDDGVTLLEVTGLDRQTETGGDVQAGPDDLPDTRLRSFDLGRGFIIFPDLRPFDPSLSDLCLEADCNYCRVNPNAYATMGARNMAWTTLDSTAYRAPDLYNQDLRSAPNKDEFSKYYLEVTYRSPISSIRLPAFNIIEGSESVVVSGRKLQRDVHYRIDYNLGEIEILDAAGVSETEDISVSYSHVPFGGGGGQKTLAGVSAFIRPEGAKWNVSSTWLFESKGGVPGLEGNRPRLGEEPSRTLVGEFAGQYLTDSWWLTDMVDKLPLLNAREASRFELEGGIGVSIPNPNTKNQLYIDDFEGAKDVSFLSISRRAWRPASIPLRVLQEEGGSVLDASGRKGEVIWYSPRKAAQEFDLQPTLERTEGDNNRPVIELYFAPRGATEEERRESWVGLSQPLSTRNGLNFSTAQFLDIWINDGVPYEDRSEREGTLYLELGQVSEDAIWQRNDLFADQSTWQVFSPNDSLDTEDVITRDGQLDFNDRDNEDTGLDNRLARDPADGFDDYKFSETNAQDDGEYQPIEFRYINGTEGNQELDTEDLNGDGNIDTFESYFEIALDLADESLWETDVRRDFVLSDPGEPLTETPADSSGWRRLRVALSDEDRVRLWQSGAGDPIWEQIFQARLWFTGFSGERERVQIAGIEVIGNRWLESPLTDLAGRELDPTDIRPGEDFYVGVVNNKDDAAIYDPPFEPQTNRDDNTTEREQSIALELRGLQPGHRAAAFKTYPQKQDFSTLYEELEFYLNSRDVAGSADLMFSVRLSRDAATDTLNYYEYRTPVPDGWVLESVDLAEWSRLQLSTPNELTDRVEEDLGGGRSIIRRGEPSLNEIRMVSFAVENVGRTSLPDGSVWVNEFRLNGVKKDKGVAARASVDMKLSNVGTLFAGVERKGADFLSIGQDQGSGTTTTVSNFRGSMNLDRFWESSGITVPLTVSQSRDRRVPKFQPNKDLILENPREDDITELVNQSLQLSYKKSASQRGWMRYLVDPFSGNFDWRRAEEFTPTRRDTTVTKSASLRWSLGLTDQGKIKLGSATKGPFKNAEINLLPTLLSWSYGRSTTEVDRYSRTDLSQEFTRSGVTNSRSTTLGLGAKLQPIRSVTYSYNSGRNLELTESEKKLFGVGLGHEVSRAQSVDANYDVPILRTALSPRINWRSSSTLSLYQAGGTQEGEPERTNGLTNQHTTSISGRFDPAKLKAAFENMPFFGAGPDSAGSRSSRRSSRDAGFRFDPVSVTYSFGESSSLNRRVGTPSLAYQLGFDTSPGDAVSSLPTSSGSVSSDNRWSFDTNVRLPFGATVRTGYQSSHGNQRRDGIPAKSSEKTWPDLDIGWGQLHSRLGLDRLLKLKSFTAKTSYSVRRKEVSSGGIDSKDITIDRSLSPLLDIRATLDNGMQATLTSSSIRSQRDRVGVTVTQNITTTNRASLQLKKNLNLRRRVKVPGSSQSRMVTTRMDVSAGVDWQQSKQENVQPGLAPEVQSDTAKWGVNTTTNYNFTDRISGTGRVGYEQTSDNKNRARNQRAVEVRVSATFTF